jgi:hypothetical protein
VAAVRLVDDHDDVASLREQRVSLPGVLLLPGLAELLQGGEVKPAGAPVGELGPQLVPTGHLLWLLRQQLAGIEAVEQLVVQVRTVGDHHDGGVAEGRVLEHLVGVQLHFHRLAGPLGVPDHSGLAVAAHRFDGFSDRLGHREVLVRLGHAL